MSQGSLSKAIREGRSIFIVECSDGQLSALEERPFPSQRRQGFSKQHQNHNPAGSEASCTDVPDNPSSDISKFNPPEALV